MRGPIDYIIIAFDGLNFKGEALSALEKASNDGTIKVLDLAVVTKDAEGNLASLEITDMGDDLVKSIAENKESGGMITDEDLEEVGDILKNNTAAGLLIIEQLWAIPLKKALLDANGVLVAEGRIHPEAYQEINN